MAKIFVTGSADGLGKMAAQLLVDAGHTVVLHARNEKRAQDALAAVPRAETAIAGDLSSIEELKRVADEVNNLGSFDAIIHNAGVGYRERQRGNTVDGLPLVFAVNSLAPYLLTCLIQPPKRLVYLSSMLHASGDASLKDLIWDSRAWNGYQAYSDTKFHDALFAFAVARLWPQVYSNAVEPGWVATKMGGAGAPDSLEEGPKTQVWLSVSNDAKAMVSGQYFYHMQPKRHHPQLTNNALQDQLLLAFERLSGVKFPG